MTRIAFLGPAGTFTEEALLAGAAQHVVPVPFGTNYGCVLAVEDGSVDQAFVPIENSVEGSVSEVLDALAFDAPHVSIVREVTHSIEHRLIARSVTPLETIETVYSHPHAMAQCRRFLHSRLPGVQLVGCDSTAEAVRTVSESHSSVAAIGTSLAARLYGCAVLISGIQDVAQNTTRFVYLVRDPADTIQRPESDTWKTSIVCGIGSDQPGALLAILRQFADRGINLTKIESRPTKTELGEYLFFIDAEHPRQSVEIGLALDELGNQLESLRTLGSYPTA